MGYFLKLLSLGGIGSTIGVSVHLAGMSPSPASYTVPPLAERGKVDISDVKDLPNVSLLKQRVKEPNYDEGGRHWYKDWF